MTRVWTRAKFLSTDKQAYAGRSRRPKDVQEVHALQDEIKASQKGSGKLEIPNWVNRQTVLYRLVKEELATILPKLEKLEAILVEELLSLLPTGDSSASPFPPGSFLPT